ncbi:hypothetical protein D9M71_752640 [compost metagenome]
MPSASSTRPRAMRSSQVSRLMAGKCAHRQSSTVAHGPAGKCRVLARCCAAEKGTDMWFRLEMSGRALGRRARAASKAIRLEPDVGLCALRAWPPS